MIFWGKKNPLAENTSQRERSNCGHAAKINNKPNLIMNINLSLISLNVDLTIFLQGNTITVMTALISFYVLYKIKAWKQAKRRQK